MLSKSKEHPLDYMRQAACRYFNRFDAIMFFIIFLVAMLVHLYMFTHKFINHDDIGALYTRGAYAIYSARWFIVPLTRLTGNISSAWLNGLVGSIFLSAASVLIIRLFGVRRYIPGVLMGVCLVSFPAIASTYCYMFSAVPYLFALFASVVGACLIRSEKYPLMIFGALAISLAMGCYQAYFCLAVTILVVAVGLDLLNNRFEGNWKRIFLTGIKYVCALVLGMILYFIILKICLHIKNVELVSYQGIDTMGQIGLTQLIQRIRDAYKGFVKFFIDRTNTFHTWFKWIVAVAGVFTLIEGIYEIVQKKLWRSMATIIFLIIIAVLFPLACSLIYVMLDSTVSAVHLIMLYPMVIVLILPAVALDRLSLVGLDTAKWKKQCCVIFAMVLMLVQILIGYECVLITNRAYFAMDITYENAYAFYTKLAAKIELQEEYTPGIPVAFIGKVHINEYAPAAKLTGAINLNSALNMYTVPHFLRYFLASDYDFVLDERENELKNTVAFQDMPNYPAAGSIQTIDGVIVVKFSG